MAESLRLLTQRFGLRTGMPTRDLIERDAPLLGRIEVSKAVVCRGAPWLPSRRVLLAAHDLKRRHMPNLTEIPLRFAPVCFPHASPAYVPEAGKQKKTPKDSSQPLIYLKKFGAGEGIRTLDPDLGKVGNVTVATMPLR